MGGRALWGQGHWDDMKTPAIGQSLDSTSGRIDFDFTELTVGFQANARYPEEPLGHVHQLSHAWMESYPIQPHIHWYQDQEDVPNWLMAYRKYNNGEAVPAVWTLAVPEAHVFTYTSGTILQISRFPLIGMSGMRISCFVDVKIYRDSANASTLFAGADPATGTQHMKEFDFHIMLDDDGSHGEFTK